jgi:hypothetical protein
MKKKPLPLILYHKLSSFIKNSKIKIMRSLGYGCENCKYCDPVCYFAGEISGTNFWCKHWEYDSKKEK